MFTRCRSIHSALSRFCHIRAISTCKIVGKRRVTIKKIYLRRTPIKPIQIHFQVRTSHPYDKSCSPRWQATAVAPRRGWPAIYFFVWACRSPSSFCRCRHQMGCRCPSSPPTRLDIRSSSRLPRPWSSSTRCSPVAATVRFLTQINAVRLLQARPSNKFFGLMS